MPGFVVVTTSTGPRKLPTSIKNIKFAYKAIRLSEATNLEFRLKKAQPR